MNNIIRRAWVQNKMVKIEDLQGMVFQAESGGHTFEIVGIGQNGAPVSFSGDVDGVFIRPDNSDVTISGTITAGVATVTLPAECYVVPGRFGLTIFVTSGGHKTAIYAAIGTVNRSTTGQVSPGATASVVDLINRINEVYETIPTDYISLTADYMSQVTNTNNILSLTDQDFTFNWVQGSIASDGTELDAGGRIRTGYCYLRALQSLAISCDPGYSYSYILYNDSKAATSASNWTTSASTLTYSPNAVYARFVLRHTDDSVISPLEGDGFNASPVSLLKTKLDGMTSDVTTLQSDMTDAETDIDVLQEARDVDEANISANSAALEKVQRELTQEHMNFPISWVQGSISNAGAETNDTTRIRSPYIFLADTSKIMVSCASGWQVSWLTYAESKTVSTVQDWTTSGTIEYAPGAFYVRFVLRRTNSGTVTPTDGTNLTATVYSRIMSTVNTINGKVTTLQTNVGNLTTRVDGLFSVSGTTLVLTN